MRIKPEDRRWQIEMMQRSDGLFYAYVQGQVDRGGLPDLYLRDFTMAYARKSSVVCEVRRLVHAWLTLQRRMQVAK